MITIKATNMGWKYRDPYAPPCDRYRQQRVYRWPDGVRVLCADGMYDSGGGPDGPHDGTMLEGSPVYRAMVAAGIVLVPA